MRSKSQRQVRSRRGATIVLVAVSSAALLAVGALAVDTGMMFKVRADGQRAADAAALAGAAEFLKTDAVSAIQPAVDKALEFAGRNYMGGRNIDVGGVQPMVTVQRGVHTVASNEATVDVIPSIFRVRVTVRRADSGLLWGNLFGVGSTAISTYAAAEAVDAGGSGCVMPFAIPDIWGEIDGRRQRQPDRGRRTRTGITTPTRATPTSRSTPTSPDPNADRLRQRLPKWLRRRWHHRRFRPDPAAEAPDRRTAIRTGQLLNLWDFVGRPTGPKPIKERIEGCDPRVVNLGDDDSYYKKPGGTTGIKNQLQDRDRRWIRASILGSEHQHRAGVQPR